MVETISKSKIDAAGRELKDPASAKFEEALALVGKWRALHTIPLETFSTGLQRTVERFTSPGSIVVSRSKRIESIRSKLARSSIRLNRMQDIVGCRAIVRTIPEVYAVVDAFQRGVGPHKLELKKDYIAEPKSNGYRGVHLVFSYQGQKQECCGMCCEVQVRTRFQHLWATTVETVGLLTKQELKAEIGDPDWLKFFAVVSALYAKGEKAAPVPGISMVPQEFMAQLNYYLRKLNVMSRLAVFESLINIQEYSGGLDLNNIRHFLLRLNRNTGSMDIWMFTEEQREEADKSYQEIEKQDVNTRIFDAVLVSAESLKSVREAFPNYFHATAHFCQTLEFNSVFHLLTNPNYMTLADPPIPVPSPSSAPSSTPPPASQPPPSGP